jgi:hypothetical protein
MNDVRDLKFVLKDKGINFFGEGRGLSSTNMESHKITSTPTLCGISV